MSGWLNPETGKVEIPVLKDEDLDENGRVKGVAEERAKIQAEKAEIHRLRDLRESLGKDGLCPIAARELLETKFAPPDWIIQNLIAARGGTERGFKGDIIAGSKMRKTFFALQLCICLAGGVDFLGLHVPKPRRVLYIGFELRKDFARERVGKSIKNIIAAVSGEAGVDYGACAENLEVMTPPKPYKLRNRRDESGKVIVKGLEDEFIEYIRLAGFDLVVIDPQYKLLLPGEDENNGQGVAGILFLRDRIITETQAGCLTVHHDNKSNGADIALTSRGSGSGFGGRDYDIRFALSEHADGDPNHEVLEIGCRVRKDPDPITIVFDEDTLTLRADPDTPAERKSKRPAQKEPGKKAADERERAEKAARLIFNEIIERIDADGGQGGADPAAYLLPKTAFKQLLRERANLAERPTNEQTKLLTAKGGPLSCQRALKTAKDGKTQFASAAILIGFNSYVDAYRREYGLDAGETMRE